MAMGLLGRKGDKEVNKVLLIPLDKIQSNPNQPRKHFEQNAMLELCRSIAGSGLLQPITVRKQQGGEGYELVAGERRTMAFRILGRDSIPAIVEEYTDQQSAVLALVENLQRKDLNYFEEAAGISRLMQELKMTQAEVSQRLGKAQSTVANKLRLLRYPFKIQEKMLEAKLTERHARALLKVVDPELQELAVEYIASNRLNVEQTERYIERLLEGERPASKPRIFVVKDLRLFLNTVNKAVDTMRASGVPVDMETEEDEAELRYVMRIPKTAAYHRSGERKPGPQMEQIG